MKNKPFKIFIGTEVKPRLKYQLRQLGQLQESEKASLKDRFTAGFSAACKNIIQSPGYQNLKISYIAFHPLRTRFFNRDFRYQIRMYDADWYLKDGVIAGDVDFAPYFAPYCILWEELSGALKKYAGAIKEPHVEQIMQSLIPGFHLKLAELMRDECPALLEAAGYEALNREERVCFYTGELMEKPALLLIDENMHTDLFSVREKIEEKSSLAFFDLRRKKFEKDELGGMDFTYTDFREAKISDTDFSGACFTGTRFQDSTLTRCRFLCSVLDRVNVDGCTLKQSLFAGAVIKNTDFTKAKMDSCDLHDATLLNCRI